MKSRISILFALGAVSACGAALPEDGAAAGDDGADGAQPAAGPESAAATLPECKAQRAVYLVGGNGGLASFTLAWPLPAVINHFTTQFAYDNPAAALAVATPHPLFARSINGKALWTGTGTSPQPSAFIAGHNETHTFQPQSVVISATAGGLMADGAVIQAPLAPVIPVIIIQGADAGPYGTAAGAPTPVTVNNGTSVAAEFPSQFNVLLPSQAQIASYFPAGANPTQAETALATDLAVTANVFKLGLVSTMIMPAYLDDPHSLFDNGLGPVTTRANNLASMLNTFYTDLGTATEASCGHAGKKLTLADNTVMVIDGDTPKDSFVRNGWPDGTPANANWIYVRSNGFTTAGWFGDIEATGQRTNFDPNTGALSATAATADDTAAAFAGVLYAISRGNTAQVATFTTAPFAGVIAH
jgi:hypothetical protein